MRPVFFEIFGQPDAVDNKDLGGVTIPENDIKPAFLSINFWLWIRSRHKEQAK